MEEQTKAWPAPFECSATLGKLAAALSKAQGEFPEAKKSGKGKVGAQGSQREYPYATLSDVIEAVRGPLAKNELSVVQAPFNDGEGCAAVRTILLHSGGEWLAGSVTVPLASHGAAAHALGSAIAYCRRYGLTALLGIATEDDDGATANEAPARQNRSAARQEAQETAPAPSWQDRCLAMMGLKFPMADTELLRRQVYSALTGKNVATVSNWSENHWQGVLVRLEKLDPAQHKEIIATLEGEEDDPFADPNEGATPPATTLGA